MPPDPRLDELRIGLLADHPGALPALCAGYEREWPEYYGPAGPGDARADLQAYANAGSLPVGVVALLGGRPVGVAALKADSIASRASLCPWAAAGWVEPSLRGSGIGHRLLEGVQAQALALGHSRIYCATRTAGTLLLRNGWLTVEEFIHEDGLPLRLYCKTLEA